MTDAYTPSNNPYLPLQATLASSPDKHSRRRSGRYRTTSTTSSTTFFPPSDAYDWPRQHSTSLFSGRWRLKGLVGLTVGMVLVLTFAGGKLGSRVDKEVAREAAEEAAAKEQLRLQDEATTNDADALAPPSHGAGIVNPPEAVEPLDRLYLLPARIGEQESKASSHLYQLGLLALALNRTLVRPHAGIGYLGQCRKLDFEEWYSEDALEEWGVTTVSQREFQARVENAGEVKARWVSMGGSEVGNRETRLEVTGTSEELSERWCLDKPERSNLGGLLSFAADDPPVTIVGAAGWSKTDAGQLEWGRDVIRLLSSPSPPEDALDLSSVPVLAVVWTSNYPAFSLAETPITVPAFLRPPFAPPPSSSFVHLTYAPALQALADRILQALGGADRVVAIHWRQETVPFANLAACGKSLISTLRNIRASRGAETVWMASDYPFEDAAKGAAGEPVAANSGTFTKSLTQAHHKAMSDFLSSLNEAYPSVPRFSSLPLLGPELDPPLDIAIFDRGTAGIIDKLVASRAGWFLAGRHEGQGYCGRSSSYTRAIVGMREHRGVGLALGQVGNDIEYWG